MKIYVGDRKMIVKLTVKDFLSDLGHEVLAYDNELALLENGKHAGSPPDVLILGLDMSREKAVETIIGAHKKYQSAHIISISEVLPTEISVPNRIFAYLHRPIHLAELELLINRLAELIKFEKACDCIEEKVELKKIIAGSL